MTVMGAIVTDALPADPLDALRELARGEAELDRLRRARVQAARATGATWEQIGEALGMSRQSAWELLTRDTRTAIARNAEANEELRQEKATGLAVAEVRAARRRR